MRYVLALMLLCVAGCVESAERPLAVSAGMASAADLDTSRGGAGVGEISYDVQTGEFLWELAGGLIGEQSEIGHFWYGSAGLVAPIDVGPATLRFGLGVGVRTWADNIDNALSSPVNFSLMAGLDTARLRLQFRHFSNAGLHTPNWGENWFLVGWKFSPEEIGL